MKVAGAMIAFAALAFAMATAETVATEKSFVAERNNPNVILCPGTRDYMLTINFKWTKGIHKAAFTEDAAFSPVVGISHNEFYTMWADNDYASDGVQEVAEMGDATTLMKELGFLKGGKVLTTKMSRKPGPKATIKMRIKLRDTRYFISMISMVAPSPDWFVGFSNKKMCNTSMGKWRELVQGNLGVYDAGTDKGTGFLSPNNPNMRKQRIENIAKFFKFRPLGTYSLKLIK